MMFQFAKLFEPGRIGKLDLKNRIIFPPMATHMATQEGDVTDQLVNYYIERARGVALVVIEGSFPSPVGHPKRIALDHDGRLAGLQKLVRAIRQEGAKVMIEVNTHMGRQDQNPLSPSDVPHPVTGKRGKPAALADIQKMVEEYGEAAKRVKKAGFDGIMIHGGTGYLVAEFLSPLVNRRTDEYGGDVRRRARFALDLIDVTRENVGPDYPVFFRVMSHDRVPGGFNTEDAITTCKLFQDHGVDAVDIITGSAVSHEWTAPPMYLPAGCNTDVSEAVRKEVSMPVAVAGKINDPLLAEQILREGKADFIDIGRGLLADPNFVIKTLDGKAGNIRRCIACLRCAEQYLFSKDPVICAVNPAVGKEKEYELALKDVKKKKRVLVVGGGPAGMEAAVIADRRGHEVTLWEKSDQIGGNLNLAPVPSGKGDMKYFLDYLNKELQESNVKVTLRKKATFKLVKDAVPDAVVLATGSRPFVVDVPGIESENVLGFTEVLSGEKDLRGEKIVVWGAGFVGCEVAYFLAEKGNEVTLIFPESEPAPEVAYPDNRKLLLQKLDENHVRIEVGIREFKEINSKGIALVDKDGKDVFFEANHIVLATGARPLSDFQESDKKQFREVYEAGDCVEVRRLLEAVHEGAGAALKI
jgi:2,4-dienoyl-CoA reductase-like NADH-dependent reductase (Old Yellow Enzyme family)/NADPH-dependent 2,4-dienoyl-CoA reductase/sulfur reductase-like enzyme